MFSLVCISVQLLHGEECKKTGVFPEHAHSGIGSAILFLPYNPKTLLINPPSSSEVKRYASVRDHGHVLVLEQVASKLDAYKGGSESCRNINCISLLPDECLWEGFSRWKRAHQNIVFDVISLSNRLDEVLVLRSNKEMLRAGKVVYVNTSKEGIPFESVENLMSRHGYLLFSRWEDREKNGSACFLKRKLYRGVYKRKLI